MTSTTPDGLAGAEVTAGDDLLLPELVAHLRERRTQLRREWANRITDESLLSAMTPQEIFSEATSVYDNYVGVLETGSVEALQDYARDLSERIIPRGVETNEVVGIVLLLRDVLARSLFEKYHKDFGLLNRVLDAYEPAANRIANTVAVSFVQERERVIRQQADAIRELSTPVLQVRERLLILPIIGVLDDQRADQLTEQLLGGIRRHRAKVVVIDITGVPEIDRRGRQPPGAGRRRVPADGRRGDHHRAVPGDRPDAGDHRRRPDEDEHRRRPAGRHRGGGAAARVQGDEGGRRRWLTRTMADREVPAEPLRVSILTQGSYLIASIHTALDDGQLVRFQRDLIQRIGAQRARGVVIDVAALDVLDSFGSRTLRDIAGMSRLRGAETVIVGIAPELAVSMVRLGLHLELPTALDLEEGLAYLRSVTGTAILP